MKRIFNNKKKSREDLSDSASSRSGDSGSLKSSKSGKDNETVNRSFQYSYTSNTNSLFSSERSSRTGISSQPSSLSYNKGADKTNIIGVGRPLRVLHEEENENEEDPINASQSPISSRINANSELASICPTERSSTSIPVSLDENEINEFIKNQLKLLSGGVQNIIYQLSQCVINLTKASINITELIINTITTIKSHRSLNQLGDNQFNTTNCVGLKNLIKCILHILDNLLNVEVYNKSKSLIIKTMYDLFVLIKVISNKYGEITNFISEMSPKLFPITNLDKDTTQIEKVNLIMTSLLNKSDLLSEQEGAFIAPVMRGFEKPELSVITFMFGFPEIDKEHTDAIKYFSTQVSDFHYLIQKNGIKVCSGLKLKSPFRTIGEDQEYIPISMSVSANNATITSGTLGGYLYPKVSSNCTNAKLLKYRGQIFGLTCAHVVLNNEKVMRGNFHPSVSTPSPVLINLYKNALLAELSSHASTTPEYHVFNDAIKAIDQIYPQQKVTINGNIVKRNLPVNSLGNIIWGERLISGNKLSDVAIIKINENLKGKKFVNYLGEDLQLSQYDPSLILSNLNIKNIVSLKPRKNGILNTANLRVFKIGSTTGYTCGRLNGMKMIYWSDGSLRSNEFVINSNDDGKSEMFANGGDSGALILSKMGDVNSIQNYNYEFEEDEVEDEEVGNCNNGDGEKEDDMKKSLTSFIESFIPVGKRVNSVKKRSKKKRSVAEKGLGVLGMLHSYDGEFKQLGLFTPIEDILDRLENVTGVKWGVVGCGEEGDYENDLMSLSSNEDGTCSN
ncbi:hypothetical protein CANINC_001467 [Pichia inconspicua]|uniref:SPS-sensor serine protease component SSY5 n=1 Tax=Pichia inconspicua TaxID=52247 RepID=A0A4T0X3L2_9ASCO|nr:hypothetical protein CANINC_001467 [[Candida] inconspicua]